MIITGEIGRSVDVRSPFFEFVRSVGLFRVGRYIQRDSGKLLILCYHGISKADEHLWRPTLYMPRSLFRQRLQTLRDFGYQVLPLATALERLQAQSLSGLTVSITFDDGWHDFYSEAWPELSAFGYPATVYQTTYYSQYQKPIFDTACSYLLWKGRGQTLRDSKITGTEQAFKLDSPASIKCAFAAIGSRLHKLRASAEDKDRLLAKLAARLKVDFGQMLSSRLLHLMNPSEIAEVSKGGIDIQLHTHRHQLPLEKEAFLGEIQRNRKLIEAATGKCAHHFCYPNGDYRPEFPAWLREAGVISATTCEPGIASRQSESMLLPRVTDSTTVSQARFESWLSGVGWLASACKRKALSLSGRQRADAGENAPISNVQEQVGTAAASAVTRAFEGH